MVLGQSVVTREIAANLFFFFYSSKQLQIFWIGVSQIFYYEIRTLQNTAFWCMSCKLKSGIN